MPKRKHLQPDFKTKITGRTFDVIVLPRAPRTVEERVFVRDHLRTFLNPTGAFQVAPEGFEPEYLSAADALKKHGKQLILEDAFNSLPVLDEPTFEQPNVRQKVVAENGDTIWLLKSGYTTRRGTLLTRVAQFHGQSPRVNRDRRTSAQHLGVTRMTQDEFDRLLLPNLYAGPDDTEGVVRRTSFDGDEEFYLYFTGAVDARKWTVVSIVPKYQYNADLLDPSGHFRLQAAIREVADAIGEVHLTREEFETLPLRPSDRDTTRPWKKRVNLNKMGAFWIEVTPRRINHLGLVLERKVIRIAPSFNSRLTRDGLKTPQGEYIVPPAPLEEIFANRSEDTRHLLKQLNVNPALLGNQTGVIAEKYRGLAYDVVNNTNDGPELTVALRKILEAKDANVRAVLPFNNDQFE